MTSKKRRTSLFPPSVHLSFLYLLVFVLHSQASITDVTILPEIPTFNDDISLFISGVESTGGVLITDSAFIIDGSSLELDISLEVGPWTVLTPWDYTYEIGLLSIGIYDLTVNSLVPSDPTQNDTFITSFEVVPEPATVLFFGLGMYLLRSKNKD